MSAMLIFWNSPARPQLGPRMTDEMILMGDALDDMNPAALDSEIAVRCDVAGDLNRLDREALAVLARLADRIDPAVFGLWLASAATVGASLGVALSRSLPRVATGYMPKPQRTKVNHRRYSDGLLAPPPRMTADDRAKAKAAKWTAPLRGVA